MTYLCESVLKGVVLHVGFVVNWAGEWGFHLAILCAMVGMLTTELQTWPSFVFHVELSLPVCASFVNWIEKGQTFGCFGNCFYPGLWLSCLK